MKIYTKTGDKGTTQLWGGKRVSKGDVQVEAYGCLDELNASLGVAAAHNSPQVPVIAQLITHTQNQLFVIGAHVASASLEARQKLPAFSPESVSFLEGWIDQQEGYLPPLTQFIIPGGSLLAAHLHVARTICRRAERALIRAQLPECDVFVVYLNRLSDALFVAARTANHYYGVRDRLYEHQQ
ncbi:MAG: cob(I)yrinic acid a,c-diamide adenosyltransferase [Bdellovibrionaceae bacterium]|nr:cob(I)yrinic acid a,c-diamide adenosyltransferase [Pseudobdellovibrionaceae bacterium]MDW8189733.1 cob(I)yrinic acid a,c-diamide adenosyltransferase [Pseudobdellovibrionaceae bacterium]